MVNLIAKEVTKPFFCSSVEVEADEEKKFTNLLKEIVGSNFFVIEVDQVKELCIRTKLDINELLQKLIAPAKSFSDPAILNYQVGAAALGVSGKIYLGVNFEFLGFPLNQTVHGEQFLLGHARNQGEQQLVAMALSAAPCGHCRQFINELGADAKSLLILTPDNPPIKFRELLPVPFGPDDLDVVGGLLTSPKEFRKASHLCALTANAIDAALRSYVPYTHSFAGVAIKTKDGKIFTGSNLENAAFNPSLSPFQGALVALKAAGQGYEEISEVVIAESLSAKSQHALFSELILKSIAPGASFKVENLDLLDK